MWCDVVAEPTERESQRAERRRDTLGPPQGSRKRRRSLSTRAQWSLSTATLTEFLKFRYRVAESKSQWAASRLGSSPPARDSGLLPPGRLISCNYTIELLNRTNCWNFCGPCEAGPSRIFPAPFSFFPGSTPGFSILIRSSLHFFLSSPIPDIRTSEPNIGASYPVRGRTIAKCLLGLFPPLQVNSGPLWFLHFEPQS